MIETRAVVGLVPVETSDDGATFESLYRTHAKRIYSLAYRFAGNAAEAEELLQDIFLLAYRKLGSFRHEAALSTWLHRLAVNRCLDHVRSRAARQDAATEPLNADHPPPDRVGDGPITVRVAGRGDRTVELTTGRAIRGFTARFRGDVTTGVENIGVTETQTGVVTVDSLFDLGGRDGTREIDGTVGDGGPRLELSTFSGDMTIVVGGAP